MESEEKREKTKKLVDFRLSLEKRIRDAEADLRGLNLLLESIDETLLGFRTAGGMMPTPSTPGVEAPVRTEAPPQPDVSREGGVPLKTVQGDLLATLHFEENRLRVLPAEDKEFNVNTPPFRSFFYEKVLTKMREADQEALRKGEIGPDDLLSFEIALVGEVIREIDVQNVSEKRFQDLKSSVRWTLEKMYEKKTES
jgi:hypothetical protein